MTDHRYAPGVTKTKGIHAPRDTPLQLEIQTGAGGEGQTLPRKFFRSALVLSFIFSFFSFLSNFSFFVLLLFVIFTFSLLPYVIAFNFSHGSPSSPRAHATNVTAESILSRFGESIKAIGICSSSTSGLFRCSASLETLASHLRGEITTTTLMLTSRTCLPPNRKLLICISIDDTVKLLLMCSP